jgi:hypothetical protein
MFLTFSFITEGASKKGVAIFDATVTNLQQQVLFTYTKMFIMNTTIQFKH